MPNDNVSDAQIAKAKVRQTSRLLKSDAARKWLRKRQMKRGGSQQNGLYKLRGRAYDGSAAPGELAKADGYIKTIYDMVDLHYGFLPEYFGKGSGGSGIAKDDNMTSSTTGVANTVFGQEVYSLLNSESNVYSLLEKRPWRRSGERIVDGRGRTLGAGGVSEDANLPSTEKPDFNTFEQTPRNIAHTFSVSQVEQLLADTEDDHFAGDPMDWLRRWYGTGTEHQTGQGEHPKHINVQLVNDPTSTGANDFRSIDNFIADGSEENNCDDTSGTSLTDGDLDIYGFDRSANEFEANVLHNNGTDRNLTVDLLDDAITEVRKNSGKDPVTDDNYFFLTDHETFQILEEEVAAKERLEPVRASVGMNGVNTQPGDDVGITVQAYKQIPIFRSDDVVQDTIGRVYLVDSSTLFVKQLLPTQYYDTGIDVDENPFGIDRLGNEGMYLTIGELTGVNPKAHAKIRDLQ